MLQAFLNIVELGIAVQQAVEAPRASLQSFPDSFAPIRSKASVTTDEHG